MFIYFHGGGMRTGSKENEINVDFGCDMDKVSLKVMHGGHCAYTKDRKQLGSIICEFLDTLK